MAWLVNLVASYILKQPKKLFTKFIYHGITQNDGFIIVKGIKTKREMNKWLEFLKKNETKLQNQTVYNSQQKLRILKSTKTQPMISKR